MRMLTAAEELRMAEEEQRLYVGTVLLALAFLSEPWTLPTYPMLLLGDLQGRVEVANSLGARALELEATA